MPSTVSPTTKKATSSRLCRRIIRCSRERQGCHDVASTLRHCSQRRGPPSGGATLDEGCHANPAGSLFVLASGTVVRALPVPCGIAHSVGGHRAAVADLTRIV